MRFFVKPTDVGFADKSDTFFTWDFTVAAPASEAFDALTDPARFMRWFPDAKRVAWVTDAPHGAGSVRDVALRGITVREKVLVWEPGRRFSFTVVESSLPLLWRMVEDFRFSSAGRETRVEWTIAYQPRLLVRPLERALKPLISRTFRVACDRLRRHLANGSQQG
ncbi:MAG: SRPBCC family protein [Deltaproteobacteria bacterium]|nr:SRPBCC family protein [Deltaproteobacteria bacterium]